MISLPNYFAEFPNALPSWVDLIDGVSPQRSSEVLTAHLSRLPLPQVTQALSP